VNNAGSSDPLAWNEALQGFPEQPLQQALFGTRALEVREHFFVHGGIPYLTLVVVLPDDQSAGRGRITRDTEDPGKDLPEELVPLYRDLRRWRNERARREGIPSYLVFRNAQLAEICRRIPRSLAALREIEGIGEVTCGKYGAEVLALLPPEIGP
jgi:superfamily II DNA helicase RecQ